MGELAGELADQSDLIDVMIQTDAAEAAAAETLQNTLIQQAPAAAAAAAAAAGVADAAAAEAANLRSTVLVLRFNSYFYHNDSQLTISRSSRCGRNASSAQEFARPDCIAHNIILF